MKKSQAKELPNKTVKALNKDLQDLYVELKKKSVDDASGKVKNVSWKRSVKKDIARILTVIRIKELTTK